MKTSTVTADSGDQFVVAPRDDGSINLTVISAEPADHQRSMASTTLDPDTVHTLGSALHDALQSAIQLKHDRGIYGPSGRVRVDVQEALRRTADDVITRVEPPPTDAARLHHRDELPDPETTP